MRKTASPGSGDERERRRRLDFLRNARWDMNKAGRYEWTFRHNNKDRVYSAATGVFYNDKKLKTGRGV